YLHVHLPGTHLFRWHSNHLHLFADSERGLLPFFHALGPERELRLASGRYEGDAEAEKSGRAAFRQELHAKQVSGRFDAVSNVKAAINVRRVAPAMSCTRLVSLGQAS